MRERSQIVFFMKRVRDFIRPLPLACRPETPLAEVTESMAKLRCSSALVVDPTGRISGILTESDIARRVAFARPLSDPVEAVMTRPVVTSATTIISTARSRACADAACGTCR